MCCMQNLTHVGPDYKMITQEAKQNCERFRFFYGILCRNMNIIIIICVISASPGTCMAHLNNTVFHTLVLRG